MAIERMSKDIMFMAMAAAAGGRSTCQRLQVGCVITNQEGTKVLGIGYNGNAAGLPNHCDSDQPGNCGCIHAEVNALLKAPYDPGQPLTLYTTYSPCLACAKLILNSQVTRVVYGEQYRRDEGIMLLRGNGVVCNMLDADVGVRIEIRRSQELITTGYDYRTTLVGEPQLDSMSNPVMTRDGSIR